MAAPVRLLADGAFFGMLVHISDIDFNHTIIALKPLLNIHLPLVLADGS
jgi:hypothetical protein